MAALRVSNDSPHQGQVLRDYELTRADGTRFLLSDYRGKLNLVLCFFPDAVTGEELLRQIAQSAAQLHEDETQVIRVHRTVEASRALPTLLLPSALSAAFDESGKAFAEAAPDGDTAIYFTDKFREIFKVYRVPAGAALPSADEILEWVKFVAMQCPECHPPEWPVDAL